MIYLYPGKEITALHPKKSTAIDILVDRNVDGEMVWDCRDPKNQ